MDSSVRKMDSPNSPKFDEYPLDADELGHYRSLHSLAVVALVLGLFSPLAFVSPLLIVVPLAAIATGNLALIQIAQSSGHRSGAALARCGLVLAIVFAVGSVVRVEFRDHLYEQHARDLAQRWINAVVAGDDETTTGLLSHKAIQDLTQSPHAPGLPPEERPLLPQLRADPLIQKLAERRGQGMVRLKTVSSSVLVQSKATQVALKLIAAIDGSSPIPLMIALERRTKPGARPTWRVHSWKVNEP